MNEINQAHTPKTFGSKIRFKIEFMMTMLASGRQVEATTAINQAIELCDEAHEAELRNDD